MGSILIVDDQADIRRVMARLLRYAGHEPAAAGGGGEALAYLAGHVPDLILLDVMMPDVDGFEVLRAVRDDPRTRGVPVVMFSAVSADEQVGRALREGATDYWVKGSIDAATLCERVSACLQSPAGSGAGVEMRQHAPPAA